MVKYENHCCDCAAPGYPCMGNSCSLRNVEIHYCDNPKCNAELEDAYEEDGFEYCADCILEMHRKRW